MPLYEFYCRECRSRFELLRPVSRMDEPAACGNGHPGAERVLSAFAAISRGEEGAPRAGTGGGCPACGGGGCVCGR